MPGLSAQVVDERDMPNVNAQHIAALMLVDGGLGLEASHDAGRMQDPRVLRVRQRVSLLRGADGVTGVALSLRDGGVLAEQVPTRRGAPRLEDVRGKALDSISAGGGRRRGEHSRQPHPQDGGPPRHARPSVTAPVYTGAPRMKLDGKVVLVTGAGRNIGRSIATLCAAEGARLIIGTAENRAALEQTAELCRAQGATEVVQVLGDVASPEDCATMVQAALDRFGHIDGLVNPVAIGRVSRLRRSPGSSGGGCSTSISAARSTCANSWCQA